jgi:hypothetical protein
MKTTHFERALLDTFKSFAFDETKVTIDFRKHGFLENQYGAYPQYSHSDAESIVDCVYRFLDAHFVDYTGRFNRSMDIDSLRTKKLNEFLLARLTGEINKDLFYAVKNDCFKTEIIDCSIADYCEDESTVEVKAKNIQDEEVTFYVQTVDQKHRSDLGCWITTDISDGEVDSDDYPLFDIGEIVNAAEQHIEQVQNTTHFKGDFYIKERLNDFVVLEVNNRFINSATSSYQREYKELNNFQDVADAKAFINQL